MAQYKCKTLLGYEDEVITEKYTDVINYGTNKIGGKPDWPTIGEMQLPPCPLCHMTRLQIIQIYAPIENSSYHRTLYLFACINPSCWNKNESWLCVRSQKLEETPEEKCFAATPIGKGLSNWCPDADDWDDNNSNANEENGNLVNFAQPEMQTDDEEESNSFEEVIRAGLGNLVVDDPNANCGAAVGEVQGGAVGRQHSPIATAEIEGNEGEVVSIDTPILPQHDIIALLQNVALPQELCQRAQSDSSTLQFVPSFMSVGEEITQDVFYKDAVSEHHIRDLLQLYQQNNEDGDKYLKCDGQAETQDGMVSEKYEKTVPAHGDKLFHHFLTRIQMNPGQILRYNRGSAPLLPSPLHDVPKKCKHCQADLVFEFQVLSTIIPILRLQNVESTDSYLEFGTVLVFTCQRSCWSADTKIQEEEVVVISEKY